MLPEAQARINTALEKKHATLNLANLGLSKIPDELTLLTDLKLIRLEGNPLTDISPLRSLTHLQQVWLDNTEISDLEALSNLKSLQHLSVENTLVADLKPLAHLSQIKSLWLNNTQVYDLTPLIEQENLEQLLINNTPVHNLGPVQHLGKLEVLWLDYTAVSNLEPLSKLQRISSLSASYTSVTDVSPLAKLHQLRTIRLIGTKVSSLRPLILLIKEKLPVKTDSISLSDTGIYVGNTPLQDPPYELVKQEADKAILDYLNTIVEEQDKEHQEGYLGEARILIVGEGKVGKTTLQRKLIDRNALLPRVDERTRKIVKKELTVAHSPNSEIRLHLWDFGGQNIQYYAHQFFLSSNAIYLLVTDERRESNNLLYWLHIIDLLGKDSPIFLLQNLKEDSPANGGLHPDLLKEFPALGQSEEHAVNLGKVYDLEELPPEVTLEDSIINHSKGLDSLLQSVIAKAVRLPINKKTRTKSFIKVRELIN